MLFSLFETAPEETRSRRELDQRKIDSVPTLENHEAGIE
jgi:hypothetical protein